MLSKVSLFTVGIISVVQTNGEHLRTNTGSKYSGVCACPGTCENGFFTPGLQTCFMKDGPHGGKFCDTKGTTDLCCVNGLAPPGCFGYVPAASSTTEYPMAHCGIYGPPGAKTCGPTCVEECLDFHQDPMFHSSTTEYPEYPMPPMDPPTAPTDHYFFHRGFGQGSPVMAVNSNKRAGCRCSNKHDGQHDYPKVASICRYDPNIERCGVHAGTEICAQAAEQATFGPGYYRKERAHCAGACKPDMALMAQSNGHQEGFTFEECSNQCDAMGDHWSMINNDNDVNDVNDDPSTRMLAVGSGCNYDGMEVWSKDMY